MSEVVSLKRGLGLWQTALYGLGTILGAGIYVLIGKVAGTAGMYAPLAFLTAGIIAAFTAFTYAELSARFPKSAGEAYYVREGLNAALGGITGWLVVLIGLTSAATMVSGFVGYFQLFADVTRPAIIVGLVLCLGVLVAWGINEAVWAVVAITVIEVGGLILVLVLAGGAVADVPARLPELAPPALAGWAPVFLGAFLAFYAFIGFEDMVNVAEEIRRPEHVLPRAIIIALAGSTFLYLAVAVVAVLSMAPQDLSESEAPLAAIVASAGHSATAIGLISMLAVVNGALVQMIMASRIIYGLANQRAAPRFFAHVHPRTRTPLEATAFTTFIMLALALWQTTEMLARWTSFITLSVFSLVNLALIAIRLRDREKQPGFRIPLWVPLAGFLSCLCLIALEIAL